MIKKFQEDEIASECGWEDSASLQRMTVLVMEAFEATLMLNHRLNTINRKRQPTFPRACRLALGKSRESRTRWG
jgi:hypothetical protein